MCKTKIFEELLNIVSLVTEIDTDEILSKNRDSEIIDARCILIHILYKKYGMTPKIIGQLISCTKTNIYHHINKFENRTYQNKMLSIQYQITLQKMEDNKLLTY